MHHDSLTVNRKWDDESESEREVIRTDIRWFMATYGSRFKVNGYDARTKVAN